MSTFIWFRHSLHGTFSKKLYLKWLNNDLFLEKKCTVKNQSNEWYQLKTWLGFNMKMKIYRMMKRWKGLGGKLESSDKAIRRTINRQGSSYKELFSRCSSIWKTFITWEQLLGVAGVRFHCLALFTTFDLGLFKNSHTHQSSPESAFCLVGFPTDTCIWMSLPGPSGLGKLTTSA